MKKGNKVDVFSFTQGYSKVTKTARAVGHGVADIYILGLWEVAGTPIEGANDGHNVQVEVFYNAKEQVSKVIVLKGDDARKAVQHG